MRTKTSLVFYYLGFQGDGSVGRIRKRLEEKNVILWLIIFIKLFSEYHLTFCMSGISQAQMTCVLTCANALED